MSESWERSKVKVDAADSPEWPIQPTGEFRGIAHKCTPVPHTRMHQSQFDSSYTSVHHIARSYTVRTGFGIGDRHFRYTSLRSLGVERWGTRMCGIREGGEDTAVSVRSVFAQADIDCEEKLGE